MEKRFTSVWFQHTSWPDLQESALLVTQYNRKKLTYQSDTLLAFSEITSILSNVFKGGFVYGLPALFSTSPFSGYRQPEEG
ncbi:hypothetical protein BS50DRAFT_578574 [Corynespora cassiicola Philippines]|uniref:Uncharacterized protein n=1 Tax=Corynespora cassiicola Philippines TaxID=1448308 RepID=A0A2T2N6Y7_CORCC|nr:hypothetical protein BS50DRAFT_578574 [Corynespora cassiicola Philippines]